MFFYISNKNKIKSIGIHESGKNHKDNVKKKLEEVN